MATVTGLTAARMLLIEAASVIDGFIDTSGHLILVRKDNSHIDAGYMLESVPQSTTTQLGTVELATSAETITGTDATRAVTPSGLAAKVSTASAQGLIQLATNNEAVAGTDATKAMTPASAKIARDYITELDGVTDLDSLITTGRYWQSANAEATTAYHYPTAKAGLLEVYVNPTSSQVIQRYTTYLFDTPGGGVWLRTKQSGAWSAWSQGGSEKLPVPQTVAYSGTIPVTATASGTALPTLGTITLTTSRDLWVDIRLKAWMVATVGETRANVVMSGATTSGWPLVNWSNVLYIANYANTFQTGISQTVKINAGATTFTVQAYRSETTGGHNVNYPTMEVVPWQWA